jgi:hypothetical protein
MAPRHPPRFVVRTLADIGNERRRRWLLTGGWLLSLVAAIALGWAAGHKAPGRASGRLLASTSASTAADEDLRQQAANLERAAQVSDIATKELKKNLAERDEEIAGLRTDLAFYSRLVGGTGQRDGLKVQGARATAVKGPAGAWNLVVTLTQNARRGETLKGTLSLAIEGIQGSKVTTLAGPALGQAASSAKTPFDFKYFQQVQGSFTLPAGFQPTRLRITADVDGDQPVSATVAWTDATRNDEAHDVQLLP